jgi:hypothetical protein
MSMMYNKTKKATGKSPSRGGPAGATAQRRSASPTKPTTANKKKTYKASPKAPFAMMGFRSKTGGNYTPTTAHKFGKQGSATSALKGANINASNKNAGSKTGERMQLSKMDPKTKKTTPITYKSYVAKLAADKKAAAAKRAFQTRK